MAGFASKTFIGATPRLSPRMLNVSSAQECVNTELVNGGLRPTRAKIKGVESWAVGTTPRTITAYTDPATGAFEGWLWKDFETDFVIRPLPNDTHERVYFLDNSSPSKLRITDDSQISVTTGLVTIANDYLAGVSSPASAPTASTTTTGSAASKVDVTYVITFVDFWGAEGPPSPVATTLTNVPSDSSNTIGINNTPVTDERIVSWRVYRSVSGTTLTNFQFVATVAVATTTYVDSLAAVPEEVVPSTNWYPAPTGLESVVWAGNGVLCGFKGNTIYFSETFLPHAWPPTYTVSINADIVGLAATGTHVFVLTNSNPYIIAGALPSAPSVQRLDTEEACINKNSIVTIGGTCFYASPNGVMAIGAGNVNLISQDVLTRQQWELFSPTTAKFNHYNDTLLISYDATGLPAGAGAISNDLELLRPTTGMIQFNKDGWLTIHEDFSPHVGIRTDTERVFIAVLNSSTNQYELWEWNPTLINGGVNQDFRWRSKEFATPRPMMFAAASVDAATYPVNFKLFMDGNLALFKSVTDDHAFRLPAGRAKYWSYEVSGKYQIYQAMFAESVRDLGMDLTQ